MINIWKEILEKHILLINTLIESNKNLCFDFHKSKEDRSDIGFNPFTLVSSIYYRENFHSDIIKALLDPTDKHNQGSKYLFLFIDLLSKNKNKINKYDFKNAKVFREKYNIDILILDDVSKKAIIIENKINNAVDKNRQLPKYYNYIKKEYFVESIVYLTLNSSKKPDKIDWTEEEIVQIEQILRIIPSYDRGNSLNLYKDWLVPSMIETYDMDSYYLLRQYSNLLKYLNTNYMDTVALEKFYLMLEENDNYKTSISIRNMLNDLPEYLAIRIEDRYKNNYYPFKSVWRHKKVDTVFDGFELENLYFKLDIWCTDYGYKLYFWNPKDEEYDMKEAFSDIKILDDFEYDNQRKCSIVKTIDIFQEDLLFKFIDDLIEKLKQKKGDSN